MKKFLFIILIFILHSCAAVGARSHYAADTPKGKLGWKDDRYYLYHSGKPDLILYSGKDIEFVIATPTLESKTYTIGPCILIPLPVIPIFGLDNSVYNDPFRITFSVYRTSSSYQLVKANILVNGKILPPTNIANPHYHFIRKYELIYEEKQLPLILENRSDYYLTYDTNGILLDSFDLMFTIQDPLGTLYIEDKITFKREKSSHLMCVL
jgi:hypothetical protein